MITHVAGCRKKLACVDRSVKRVLKNVKEEHITILMTLN